MLRYQATNKNPERVTSKLKDEKKHANVNKTLRPLRILIKNLCGKNLTAKNR